MADEDNEDNEPVQVSTEWTPLKLSELFDFKSTVWSARFTHFANLSFDEELALYELVELDADGEIDVEFDGAMEDILAN